MKKILMGGVAVALITVAMFSGCLQNGKGTLELRITDAPSDLNITHANLTISEVQVHRSAGGGNNTTAGWYTVVNESKTFDLIALANATEFFGSANIGAGMYTQIRLTVDSCVITVDGVEHTCKVSSGKIKLIKPFMVRANKTLILTLDFDAQKSISENGNQQYIFNPVIKVIQG
jgi:hypothetical protein